ncbi:LPXTG cell wall anchor domain-containing protein [Kitasatospora sp. NPDC058162]|uniref:LPXTG cell wall anchor domain-containing protein n=1 Tax=Kitasatospora sp. NPDC058162 TaxID=3346362 RepID=UPI0036DE5608
MRFRPVILAASLIASPLALALPAQAAGPDKEHSLTVGGFTSVEAGGGWSEGTVTVKNDADAPYSGQHLVLYFGTEMLGTDQITAEYADGASGAWKPVKLVDQDLGAKPAGHQGVATDLTGAGIDVQPHASRTFKLRFKLVQSTHEGPYSNVTVEPFLAPALGADGQAKDFTVRGPGWGVKTTGLTTAVTGLPKDVPADGKPHAFQVSIKTANGFDWHLTTAAFFLWAGQKYGSMNGPAACDAQMDVQDPKDGSWHKVGMQAGGAEGELVDLTKWATGPVDDRVLNARVTLGKNFKTDTDASLGFGQFGGADQTLFWVTQPITATPVDGAPECLGQSTPAPAPTTAAPAAVPAAAVTTAVSAAKPAATTTDTAATTGGGAELADTGSDGAGLTAGIAGALLAVGGAAVVLTRRRKHGN